MMPASAALFLLLLLGGALLLLFRSAVRSKKPAEVKKRLPPGPHGLPIVGHLHMLSPRPYRDLHRLAAAYGPVIHLRLGSVPTAVISSAAAALELFKSHDLAVSGRPHMHTADFLAYGSKGLGPSQYGPYWRFTRKLLTAEFVSNQKIESFAPIRRDEVGLLVAALKNDGAAVVDITAKVSYLVMDVACRMVMGSKGVEGADVEEVRGVRWAIHGGAQLLATFNVADFIPFAALFDLQGLRRRMQGLKEATDRFLDKIIDGRVCAAADGRPPRDLVDVLVSYMAAHSDGEEEFQFDRNNVKALTMETIAAMVEPIVTIIEWAMSELLKHQKMMKMAQQELESIVGMDRLVDESDLTNLQYLDMVLKETMRLHTPLPILIPRWTIDDDCTVNGFDIPRGSEVIINAWAIARDPATWPDPERFHPERFRGSKVDVRGHDFELLPFGSGRRGCPGVQLGLTMVRLVLAQLIHCFDWELPGGVSADELEMDEVFGITAPRAKHLLAIPTYRLV